MIGLIIASYGFGSTFAALINAKVMYMFKKKTLLYISLVFFFLATVSFGILDRIDDIETFKVVSLVSRFIMGFMSGSSSTIIFSLLPILYPGEVS